MCGVNVRHVDVCIISVYLACAFCALNQGDYKSPLRQNIGRAVDHHNVRNTKGASGKLLHHRSPHSSHPGIGDQFQAAECALIRSMQH